MELEKAKITELISPTWNPRKITERERKKLTKSIDEYGYVAPVIVNRHNNHIVGGNQRVKILEDLGYKEIDVIYINEPNLEREKALNISLNKNSGDWDIGKLEDLLVDLELSDVDLDLTGFDNLDFKEFNFDIRLPKDKAKESKPNAIIEEVIITTETLDDMQEENTNVKGNTYIPVEEHTESLFDSIEYEDDTVTVFGETEEDNEEETILKPSNNKEDYKEPYTPTNKDKVNEVLTDEYKVLLVFNNKTDLDNALKKLKLDKELGCSIKVL